MVKIRRQIQNDLRFTSGKGNPGRYLTIHQTDNWSRGANAAAHANLQSRLGLRNTSWHWTVDDKEAVQSYENNVKCWHAGDGGGPGNMQSIAIESCLNSDADLNKVFDNTAQLAAHILKTENIDISRMVQHNHWSGKNCPSQIRKDKSWGRFVELVKKYLKDGSGSSSGGTTTGGSTGPVLLNVDGYFGPASVKRLQLLLGTDPDGVVSSQSPYSRQYHVRLESVNYSNNPAGSLMVAALQRKLGVAADGYFGPATIKAWQKKLGVAVDGYFGPATVKAVQRKLNEGKIW